MGSGDEKEIEKEIKHNKMSGNSQIFATTLPPLNIRSTNLAQEWKSWSKQFYIFMLATNLEEQQERRKVALLLHHLGADCFEIFNSFNMDIEEVKLENVLKKFCEYFIPKANVAMERYKFFTRQQNSEETISEYATALQNLSTTCEFKDLREDLVRDIFICGLSLNFKHIKERLLSEGDIKWGKALEIAKNIEIARQNATTILKTVNENVVAGLKKQRIARPVSVQQKHSKKECKKCGQLHKFKCPADGVICHICKKPNHYAKMCFSRSSVQQQQQQQQQQYRKSRYIKNVSEETKLFDDDLFVGTISKNLNKFFTQNKSWNVDVNIEGVKVNCQVDSGAETNLYCRTFSGEKLPIIGKVHVDLLFNNIRQKAIFHVVNMQCNNVLGLDLAVELNLIKIVNAVSCNNKVEINNCNELDIFGKYSDVFNGLGQLKNKCKLEIRDNSTPVVDVQRRVPFSLLEPLKKELQRMKELEVITEVTEPTEWVSSIVIVTKQNGNIRLCLDPRNLNKAIVRPRFSFPNLDECRSQMAGSKVFSSLDASSGFWMVPLDENSSKLCTFNTPFGRFRFLRLPFGINAAPEIFHGEMVRLFGDIKLVIIYLDDFLIYAKSIKEHNDILYKVLKRATEIGHRFNKSKSKLFQTNIKFIGHIFNEDGIKPDTDKIRAITEFPTPANSEDLQRFLGMINYLGSFIQNLSTKNFHLRNLLKKDVIWDWGKAQEEAFNNLKKEITKAPVLTYFDVTVSRRIKGSYGGCNYA
ncbi:uncharacterized protein K02A2.6-like [Teleopsis dalmanni]|uniref:uncharacterized protein K02A2.6-like n=1 Tax=Teleopsis dalmanni TaxID=139649 RepID=UPI0018CFAD03|nr:uncharacterized protein K02A2.6-like [Teleopsis dalmanni]